MTAPVRRPPVGARRRRLVLELPVEEPDGFGGVLRRYVAGPVVWGAITPVGTLAREAGGRWDALATHRVTVRARAGLTPAVLTPAMRLTAGVRRFAIRTVTDGDALGRDLVCHVEELPAEAGS